MANPYAVLPSDTERSGGLKRWRVPLLLAIVVLGGLIFGVALTGLPNLHGYAPSAGSVRAHTALRPFQVQATKVKGLYGNLDVDSIVFRYTTTAADKASFRTKLIKQATAAGWTELPEKDSAIRFERLRKKGNHVFASAEEVRIKYSGDTKRVCVAWVQGDSVSDVASFAELSEAEFAESLIWPMLDEAE